MDKTEKIKKLKRSIKRIERSIEVLKWLEIEVRGVLKINDFTDIYHSNADVLQKLEREKYILEEALKTLEESNENTINS